MLLLCARMRRLVLLRVTPAALISSLNNGLSGWTGDSTAAGRFPQVGRAALQAVPTHTVKPPAPSACPPACLPGCLPACPLAHLPASTCPPARQFFPHTWYGAPGATPQIGGMRLAFNPNATDKFSRLVDVRLNISGSPSVSGYSGDILLLTNNFVAGGGDK
jgi:hypothetical protein